jgi:hypothetical protein
VRFAQKLAVAQRTNVVVVVNATSVSVCYTNPGCGSPVTDPTTKYALDGTAGTQDCSLAAADGLTGVCIIEDIADTSFTAQVSYICAQ